MAHLQKNQDVIYFSGELTARTIEDFSSELKPILKEKANASLRLDLTEIEDIDSAGVAFLDEVIVDNSTDDRSIRLINVPDDIQDSIDSFTTIDLPEEAPEARRGFYEYLDDKLRIYRKNFISLLFLVADVFYWSVVGLFRWKGQRKGSLIQQSLLIGVDALPIVVLISFLIGFILALQSAAQLRQFGANIFVADLIGIAMLREMGPIMTAIVVAGRSGSAIASEIATMVVTEEIDALQTMALNPIRFVVVPKFHAITLTMPMLTILSNLVGILGGFVIAVTYLQLSAAAFFNELLTVLFLKDVMTGLFKSVVFAWIIVIIGCYFGMQVKGGAEGVGKSTTASVVASIFFVIVADSILGLIFYFGDNI
ncbi:MlaE family lipid ABC transporter permease subunit [candidate division KSB1 bacterium]|nr:MlaE family lipid ABC transporter permease subunit [candidate division KSB1 bacterium]